MLTEQMLAECDDFAERWAKVEAESYGGVIRMLTAEVRRLRAEVEHHEMVYAAMTGRGEGR